MALAKLNDGGGAVFTPTSNPGGPSTGGTTPAASAAAPTGPSASAPPTVAPTTGPDSITVGGSPGYTPDYTQAIQNDPGYAGAQSAAQLAASNATAQRQAALRSAVIQYGGLPANFKDPYGDIDQATLDAAAANQYSTLAGVKRNYQQSVDQFRKALAARGALQSGDLGYGQDQLDTGYGQNEYDAANVFGGQGQSALNAYTGVLSANAQNLAQAIQGAAANAYNDPNNKPVNAVPGTIAKRNAAASDQYGISLYDDGKGGYYDQNGNPWSPPAWSYTTHGNGPQNAGLVS